MNRRRLIPLILLLTLLAVVAVAYSVAISLQGQDIDQLGGTDKVSVTCPVSGCRISEVKWVLTGSTSTPYQVDKVKVYWTPADSKTYAVYVELYDNNNNLKGSGSGSNPTDGYTEVDISPDVDPKDIYSVRIVIVET